MDLSITNFKPQIYSHTESSGNPVQSRIDLGTNYLGGEGDEPTKNENPLRNTRTNLTSKRPFNGHKELGASSFKSKLFENGTRRCLGIWGLHHLAVKLYIN
jgi:hypothetical protein